MSMREEIRKITAAYEADSKTITAEAIVEAAIDEKTYPHLHQHLWAVSESTLAGEARIARAHRLLISVRVVTEEGNTTRLLMHTPGVPGYKPTSLIASNPDLAAIKLRQLKDDISRSRARLNEFRAIVPSDIADEIDAALEEAEAKARTTIEQREAAA